MKKKAKKKLYVVVHDNDGELEIQVCKTKVIANRIKREIVKAWAEVDVDALGDDDVSVYIMPTILTDK